MANKGGSENDNSNNLATMDDLKKLESSMMSKFEEMMTILQFLKPNPMVSLDTPQTTELPPTVTVTAPGVTPTAVTTRLGLRFVAQTSTKVPSENTEEPENPTSKKENGGKDYSA